MAFPIETYVDIYDETYVNDSKNRGAFGHLVVRDSRTGGKDYLLVGINRNDTADLDVSIRLNTKQVGQVMRGLQNFLDRVRPVTIAAK